MHGQVETIYRAVEYIESHLQREVTVAEIAESVGYSVFHFMRTFNRVVHHTPYDYLIRRRLSEAALVLTATDRRIIDIAQDFCFNNHEVFSRAFKRMFQVQPSQWREGRVHAAAKRMPPKSLADLKYVNRADFYFPLIEERGETCLRGLMTAIGPAGCASEASIGRVLADLSGIIGASNPAQRVAVRSYFDEGRQKGYLLIGVNPDELHCPSPALVTQVIPAGRYALVHAAEEDRQPALDYLFFTWLPKAGLQPAWPMEIELAPRTEGSAGAVAILIPVEPVE